MAFSYGTDSWLMYAIESTEFTYETPTVTIPHIQESMSDEGSKPISNPAIIKGRSTAHGDAVGRADVGGQVRLPLTAENIGGLLHATLGTKAAPTGAGPYVHVLTPGAIVPFSMQIGWDDTASSPVSYWKDYTGCQVAGLTLSNRAGEFPAAQFDLKARAEEVSDDGTVVRAQQTPSYGTQTYFEFQQATVDFDSGGTECFEDLNLNIRNMLTATGEICPSSPRSEVYVFDGKREVTGTIGQNFADWTRYRQWQAGTLATLELLWNAGANAQLQIDLRIRFTGETAQVAGMERIRQGVPFSIESPTSDADAMTVTLTSDDATI